MENYLLISYLNDYVFCPRSIYFHQLYGKFKKSVYQKKPQIAGTLAHETVDNKTYSTRKNVLQGLEVFSQKYNLCGKIDLFDIDKKRLSERKRSIQKIYDGYIFQIYGQYFALREMGYEVDEIVLYDLSKNKTYPIALPEKWPGMMQKFEEVISNLNHYDLSQPTYQPNPKKCKKCIYSNLCDQSLC